MQISFGCECGSVRGVLQEAQDQYGRHFICMCDDCQAFAHYLGREKDVLDRNGGTDIMPCAPARVKFTDGFDKIKCLRLSAKGMYRWYADCCKFPLANTMSAKMPYVGLFFQTIDQKDQEKMGPLAARVLAKFGIPPLPKGAHQGISLKFLWLTFKGVAHDYFKRLSKPSPVFDVTTGAPLAPVKILSEMERNILKTKVST